MYLNYSNGSLHLSFKLEVVFFHSMAYIQDIEYITIYTAGYRTALNKGENWQSSAPESPAPINLTVAWCYNWLVLFIKHRSTQSIAPELSKLPAEPFLYPFGGTMRQSKSCSSAHALLSPMVHPRLGENGRAYVGCALTSRTNTPSCPVLVTNAFCFAKLLWRTSQLPAEKQCVSPLGKIKTLVQFLKEKYYSSLLSPC